MCSCMACLRIQLGAPTSFHDDVAGKVDLKAELKAEVVQEVNRSTGQEWHFLHQVLAVVHQQGLKSKVSHV